MAFWKGVGGALRGLGQAIESVGVGLQGKLAYKETCKDRTHWFTGHWMMAQVGNCNSQT